MVNIWSKFHSLLPKKKHIVGTILTYYSDTKMSKVKLLSNDEIYVKGVGDVGKVYLIEDGEIKREMPNLTVFNETIF